MRGRYKNVSEVVRAGLRLLEEEENRVIALKKAIQEGMDSPRVENIRIKFWATPNNLHRAGVKWVFETWALSSAPPFFCQGFRI